MIDDIKKSLDSYTGDWSEKKGLYEFKLTYSFKMRIEEESKVVKFSEMLMEAGSGFTSGGYDDGMSTGFGFKTETYNTTNGGREGNIQEQSDLFGKKYEYTFDYKDIRSKVEEVAKGEGYIFEYQILPVK
ncbi:MAG: hypothetical protein UR64_C0026G0009 [Candidatus Nomurabacteria bacterium GW2011_GWE1_35_16]|uniref:Uncharacterized protein n=1 Tax=Candidatus Nomurabacteria bacterium GW2011_GWE1_35_16 TaxID=1618761 RepID=A0A0G0DR20_9BACT|nr:MAG: hypothetical protein UR64_C0026G0009 [Candidatus Nomurabacteria bacterium GW2011_GWE1_35_16]